MKPMYRNFSLSMIALALLSGCATTTSIKPSIETKPTHMTLAAPPQAEQPLTLKQIMADPDWMGVLAQRAYWADDGQSIYYYRQASASPIKQFYQQQLASGEAQQLSLQQLHLADQRHGVLNQQRNLKAYIYQGNLFVKSLTNHKITQLTQSDNKVSDVSFIGNDKVSYWQGDTLYAINLKTNLSKQLASLKTETPPKSIAEPDSYLAKQQHRLINYVANEHDKALQKQAYQQHLHTVDPTLVSKPFYLGSDERIVAKSLSPDGRYIIVALASKNDKWRSEHDIMPNYLAKEGYVDPVPARARVAEASSEGQRLIILDIKLHKQIPVTIEGLTDYDQDVLAQVKLENAKAQGVTYQSQKQPRKLQLMQDWGWSQSAIVWGDNSSTVAIMLEAQDNKDRWIASVNLSNGKLTTEHRLHDQAWINYTHNQFGLLPNSDTLYYLSEESGYSQLYLKTQDNNAKALTQGEYVVSDVTLSPDGQYIYYKANKSHPGIYNVYRVNLSTTQTEQLTDWQGVLDYQLSPNGQALLLTASTRIEPEELYWQPIGGKLQKLTDYTSPAFKAYPWQSPEVVAVPSTHGSDDIYARVYLPQGYDANNVKQYPAVIFNHGAGYLQNAHYGFSGYFREFMFHNLLAQQGYVVMDMDYRGSKGYGRDWRTAIYRQMGHPEVEDLADGVNWMAAHTNVDAKRVGTYGGSYGGFLTFMALFTEPELFQAGAALRPVTDWLIIMRHILVIF